METYGKFNFNSKSPTGHQWVKCPPDVVIVNDYHYTLVADRGWAIISMGKTFEVLYFKFMHFRTKIIKSDNYSLYNPPCGATPFFCA